jgi:predicted dehydrogenase
MTYRVGIIGLGRIAYQLENDPLRGEFCTHAASWLAHDDVSIVAGCDIDEQRRLEFLQRFPEASVYADYREMLDAESLDFVSVCAYASDRSAMVIDTANSGVKGIWCEKAMACSIDEANAMEAALLKNNTKMIVSYIRRWTPSNQKVKQLVEDGAIGRLQSINVHFSGNFLHTGTHAFDLMRFFAGDVTTAQAWLDTADGRSEQSGYRYGRDGCDFDFGGFGLLNFENGVRGTIHGEDKQFFRFELELLGSEGMIRIGNTQRELWSICEADYCTGLHELKQTNFPAVEAVDDWPLATKNLIRAVSHDEPLLCDVNDGRSAMKVALALHQSHIRNNSEININDVPTDFKVQSR